MRAVTSDLWYTILYLRPHDQAVEERRRRGIWMRPLLRAGVPKPRAQRLVLRLEARCHGLETRGVSFPVPQQAEWLASVGRVPIPVDDVIEQLDDLLTRTPVRFARGAVDVLERWRGEGLRLGLVSNVIFETPTATRRLLDREGLIGRFDAIYLSAEHPWGKPDPHAFLTCLHELGVPPSRSVHVGDRPWDVRGALRAGMQALRFREYRLRSDPTDYNGRSDGRPGVHDVRGWAEVAQAVERMRSPSGAVGRGRTRFERAEAASPDTFHGSS
ncbi:MAG: HAD family hydrolase [Thermoplasmata archaeon]